MILSLKKILSLLVISIILIIAPSCHKPSGGYNPYLHAKVKPSAAELKRQTKQDRKARKAYRKQARRTSMHMFGHKPGPNVIKLRKRN